MSKRRHELLAAIEAEDAAHTEWQEGEDLEPTAEYWQALDTLLGTFQYGEIPADLVPVARRLDRLRKEYEAFNETGAASPHASFWRERDEVQIARHMEKPKLPVLPTVEELKADRVGIRQMCRFYWFLDGENPDTARMQRELDKPGSELTPEWLAYVEQKRLQLAGWHFEDEVRQPPKPVKEHVAPLEEMIAEHLPLTQIVNVKARQYAISDTAAKMSLGSCIKTIAWLMGVDLPDSSATLYAEHHAAELKERRGLDINATPLPASHAPGVPDFTEPPVPEPEPEPVLSLEDRVIELSNAGHTPEAIADALVDEIQAPNRAKRVRKIERLIERLSQAEVAE